MKICMLVFNNAARDGRVMREARSLRAAGFTVDVVGVPEDGALAPYEVLPDGLVIHRVNWRPLAEKRARRTAFIRMLPTIVVLALAIFGMSRLQVTRQAVQWALSRFGKSDPLLWSAGVLAILLLLATAYFMAKALRGWIRIQNKKAALRTVHAEVTAGAPSIGLVGGKPFPVLKSRIPDWLPEFALEALAEPFHWIGGRVGRFVLYRYRAEVMAEYVAKLRPDVLHCHDCISLPTGALVKRRMDIRLVYDAHEIYEAAAATRVGITDYYARIHSRYLGDVDALVTINQCAADYYRQAYPQAPAALIIRNAANSIASVHYDGRLHEAAKLPRSENILLYHGGFTLHRGLPTLVRAGALLPSNWSLVLMGWGPLTEELRTLANPQKVHFLPGVPLAELHLWSAGGRVGIIPYENNILNHWICTPNKLWEFPVAGVPIVVQPFPELRGVVERYGCGWVLPEALTPAAIADLIAGLTDEKIAKAREGCRRFIAADNWEAVYEPRLVEFYRGMQSAGSSL